MLEHLGNFVDSLIHSLRYTLAEAKGNGAGSSSGGGSGGSGGSGGVIETKGPTTPAKIRIFREHMQLLEKDCPEDTVAWALTATSALIAQSVLASSELLDAGIVSIVILCLLAHPSSLLVTEKGVEILSKLTSQYPDSVHDLVLLGTSPSTAAGHGAAGKSARSSPDREDDALLTAMGEDSMSDLLKDLDRAVSEFEAISEVHLSVGDGTGGSATDVSSPSRRPAAMDGLGCVLRAMEAFESVEGIQVTCARVLWNFVCGGDAAELMRRAAATTRVLRACETHTASEGLVVTCLGLLAKLSETAGREGREGQEGREGLEGGNGERRILNMIVLDQILDQIGTVLACVRKHMHVKGVCCWGSVVLACQSRGADRQMRLGTAGSVDTILDALREHKDNENVAQVACSALRGLLEGCPFNQARVDDGGADLVSAVAALHPANAALNAAVRDVLSGLD